MTPLPVPSIFDTFNARQLAPSEVAKTFVPPDQFKDVAAQSHALVVGPRGSGKTTLLKMLQPAALEAWAGREADRFRSAIKFTGVFVATDITWNEQVRLLGDGGLDPNSHGVLARAVFTTQALSALIGAMCQRTGRLGPPAIAPHLRVDLSTQAEEELANEIKEGWRLERCIPRLEGVRAALRRRLSDIKIIASREATLGAGGRNERLASVDHIHLDLVDAAGLAVGAFEARTASGEGKWAFLIDELELAPEWMRTRLVRQLRSVDDRFLFKISLSPYATSIVGALASPTAPAAGQDYTEVRLWYVNKERAYSFCEKLLRHLPGKASETDAVELFGRSAFAADPGEVRRLGTAYHSEARFGRVIRELATRDASFARYLASRGIDPRRPQDVGAKKRPADLRKARGVIELRAYYRGPLAGGASGTRQSRRSRKAPTVYAGATSLFAMVEGNPRWLKAIVGGLVKDATGRVPRSAQVRAVMNAGDVFRAMLRNIPVYTGAANRGLLGILDPVGEYFAYRAIDAPFDPDPPCSFTVDSAASEEELSALGLALNAGAIVYAPTGDDQCVLGSLRGKRFRIAYILAPYYCIPLILGRPQSLGSIRADVAHLGAGLAKHQYRQRPEEPSLFEGRGAEENE